ncbi:MAG: hypothetical protein DSZ06_03435 [Sulfurospirillum sp.]|nr:MAG: hypothetical protein DSZ06_03435 [Sulfurospirillum sp.]
MFGFSRVFILFTLVVALIFALFPDIDLRISELFFDPKSGFYLKDIQPFAFLHDEIRWILLVPIAFLLLLTLYQLFFKKRFHTLNPKAIVFIVTFLIVGPGIVSNTIIKDHSTRVRPRNIEYFGANQGKIFTPYYSHEGKCKKNCSFISGHTAAATFFLVFAYLYKSRLLFFLSLGFVILMGITRVVQGAHFLSDVIFSFIINLIILKILYFLFFKEEAKLE